MKKLFTFLAVAIFFTFCNAQFRFVYKATYKPVKSQDKIQSELMALEIFGEKSVWFSINNYKIDSAFKKNDYNIIQKTNEAFLHHRVEKDLNKQNLVYTESFNSFPFSYLQSPKMKWKLGNETSNVMNHKTQMASCEFGGRIWQAEFSTDFPISDGPYKFSGLPGLILKIKSQDKDYVFEMIAIEKINKFSLDKSTKFKILMEKNVKEFKQNFIKNPSNFPINWSNKFKDVFEYTPINSNPEEKKSINLQVENALKKFDNPIEKEDIVLVW